MAHDFSRALTQITGIAEQVRFLAREKRDTTSDAEGGHPAAAIDVLFQVDMRDKGVGEESQRGGRRTDDADVAPRQGDKQAKESDGHEAEADHEAAVGDDAANHANDAMGFEKQSEVADLFMARDCSTSPGVEAMTTAAMPPQTAKWFTARLLGQLLRPKRPRARIRLDAIVAVCAGGRLGASGHEANAGHNEDNAEPALKGHMLVQEKFASSTIRM